MQLPACDLHFKYEDCFDLCNLSVETIEHNDIRKNMQDNKIQNADIMNIACTVNVSYNVMNAS